MALIELSSASSTRRPTALAGVMRSSSAVVEVWIGAFRARMRWTTDSRRSGLIR